MFARICVVTILLCAVPAFASTYIGGVENWNGPNPTEGIGDFNDLVFSLTGAGLSLVTSDGKWYSFDSSLVNQNGTTFWDNASLDGGDKNIGYCLTTSNCSLAGIGVNEMLANSGGMSAPSNNFYFTWTGQPTAVDLLEIALRANIDAMGWYDITNPNNRGTLFTGPDSPGASLTFTPSSQFGLWFTNGTETFYSQTSLGSYSSDSRFAMFTTQNPATIPEPATLGLTGLSFVLAGMLVRKRK